VKFGEKKDKDTEPRVRPEPIPADPKFVEFLLSLWSQNTVPQKIEVWTVRNSKGKIHRLSQIRPPVVYPPTSKEPTQEELVELSNRILYDAQRNCDVLGKQQTYGVIPYQFGSGDDYICVWPITLKPKERILGGSRSEGLDGGLDDDDDDMSGLGGGAQARLLTYSLKQNEQSLADRRFLMHEVLEIVRDSNEQLRAENESLRRQLESMHKQSLENIKLQQELLDRSQERKLKARWSEVGIGTVEKTVETGLAMLPPLLNRLSGKEVVKTSESMESIIVANFIKSITPEQARTAFGYQGEGMPSLPDAIFTNDQAALFGAIAAKQLPGDKVDEFLPGGKLEITGDQLMRAQQCFTPEQLYPIGDLIRSRMERKASLPQNK
jgi:hypothetical protein